MSTLLIQNIRSLVSCDDADTVYEYVDLYAKDGFIRAIGKNLPQEAEKVIDVSHMLCYPGLVNTHHHLYQVFSRNLPEVQNMELFDWLKTLSMRSGKTSTRTSSASRRSRALAS